MSSLGARQLLAQAARQNAVVRETSNRPWPMPAGAWLMAQSWEDLLFAHWTVEPEALREHVPPQLELDLYGGQAWLGITPFRLTGLRLHGVLPVPRASSFLELNVRTYVNAPDGLAGIWFFSLDASSRAAVETARLSYRLPYFHARMAALRRGDEIDYTCARSRPRNGPVVFSARYGPRGDVFNAGLDTLEHFLTERFCLYSVHGGRLLRAEIHHPPWTLQPAWADIDANTMPPPGVPLPDREPLLHFAARQDVVIWPLRRVH